MRSRAVKAKIHKTLEQTSNASFLDDTLVTLLRFSSSASFASDQICPNRVSHLHAHQQHKYGIFPTISFVLIPKANPLLLRRSSYFSHASQPFEETSQRDRHAQDTPVYSVLELIKSSAIRHKTMATSTGHCVALKIGSLAHLPTSTSLLTAYSRARDFGSSLALFDEIHNRDVIIWNAMITACVENGCYKAAMNFFAEMTEEGTGFDSTTLLVVVSASSHLNHLKQGQSLHGLSLKAGMLFNSVLCNALVDMYAKSNYLSSSERMFAGTECRDTVSWNSMISGCLYNNHPEKSLWYFKEMAFAGERPDSVSLSSAISASSCLGDLIFGQVIHGWVIKLGYEDGSHISVANSLISLYSHCGDIEAAETVFRETIHKDAVSWNAMLEGFASNGKISEAFDLLHEMQITWSVQPDKVTIVTTIPLCAEKMLLREGRTLHGFTIRMQMETDLSVKNCLMDMYSKFHSLTKAELLFNSMTERDLVSWNTMVSGYSQNGYFGEAQNLFRDLLRLYSKCSLSTLLAILPSCDSHESLQFGESIHSWQLKLGFSNDILAVNSLMYMYINCGDLKATFALLQRIFVVADIASWNTVIAGCTQNSHFLEALKTFNLMRLQEPNVNHDSVTLVNVISACGNLGLVSEGKSLHGVALKTLMGSDTRVQNALISMYGRCGDTESAKSVFDFCSNRNLCSWNCMISIFSQNKNARRALELFSTLEYGPNEITFVGILSACTQLGVLRYGKEIHGHVLRLGFQENPFISAALLDMYSNCGRLDIAIQIFRNTKEKSVATWNSMISAYGYHSNGRKAIETLHKMNEAGIVATKSTFISLLSACSHAGLVNEGIWYYDHMLEEYGVEPVTEHHVCIVDMLGRSGKLHEAYEFIKQMRSQPEAGVWGALLTACNCHGDLEMGRKVAKLLFELEPENVGYYISLSNMYVSAGSWKDAVELRETIQDQRLKKPAGYSLIDVG
ncbi:pentatricopeptide repeat-containing protein At4g19220, mitochondrial [Alnus glutinosa]|uniref:pentatricopeptide repeat-containing protein At4g19220, mitochondrial n=1 Tax=Alnus glutinosa TaxID=3517 RepID=UPI002D776DD5|nr:pentatricopeptide repeat-containing protein At4g19220, mitochondrial [Alnus glutinosa]